MVHESGQIPDNIEAWREGPYAGWVARYGRPEEAARRILERPERGLDSLLARSGPVAGKRVVNVMGSSGVRAVSLALLGAAVTVIDVSPDNARYAEELASCAGVEIEYLVADLLDLPGAASNHGHDIAFAELGIVHYFTDLAPFVSAVGSLLTPDGLFVLVDFHPVSTKLLTYRGSTAKVRKYKVTGDYFDQSLEEHPVPFAKHDASMTDETVPTVRWRRWTLGEIVTAVASGGFRIEELEEAPNRSSDVFDRGIPKTFTLASRWNPRS